MAEPLLEARSVAVRYRDGALGVHDVSLEVRSGQTVALLGPNGAGKSTTLRALSGLLRSERTRVVSGTVHADGHDITNWEPHQVAHRGVVCVPERRKIFPNLTVLENLHALGRLPRGGRRRELLETAYGLFPMLAERRGDLAGRLSGGQQQMLAIARGLLSEARVLLLDEMTLGLHESVKPVLAEAVREINRTGTAVLISDESADFALSLSDYVYLIRDGLIAHSGEPATLAPEELGRGYLG